MATGYGSDEVMLTYAEGFTRDATRGLTRAAQPDPLDAELAGIKADRKSMDQRLVRAVRLLADQNKWNAVIRLLVLAGSYQQADIAKATGVMRSTVTRWFNGETVPQAEQVEIYIARLVKLLEGERDMNVFARVEDMIID